MVLHPSSSDPRSLYESRVARFLAECARIDALSRRLSHVRALLFIAIVGIGLWVERAPGPLNIGLAALGIAGFGGLVAVHQRLRHRRKWCRDVVTLNREGSHRLGRDWDHLPVLVPRRDVSVHAYAADLDLFGRASLAQILGPAGSVAGAATLEDWLLNRAPADTVVARQLAVTELAPQHEFRETLAIHGRRTRDVRHDDVQRFLAWAEQGPWLRRRVALRLLAWVLPGLTWLLIALHATGVVGSALWLLPMSATLGLYFASAVRIRRTFDEAFGREGLFSAYPELLRVAAAASFEAPALREISRRLRHDGEPADGRLRRLHHLMHLADLRLSLIHFPVYLVTMWDFHVLVALERWQESTGRAVRDWLAAVGELEALSALASLAHDQPTWAFAEFVVDGPPLVDAIALGHPLIPDSVRVCNDVQIGPPGSFVFVTGSNMSGKSTLLRAVGANVVLAQAGAPSCARRLRIPPLEVCTSIRVQDSLARGVSYFMAELERLKQIVDAAHAASTQPEVTMLYLLDEILHGTNTAERRIAARRVIRHLIDSGAIGAVTTHDLELTEEPALEASAQLVHFQENFEEGDNGSTLNFDYRLRPGVATSTNALKLMRLVGLPGD